SWRARPDTDGGGPRWLPVAVFFAVLSCGVLLWQAAAEREQGLQTPAPVTEVIREASVMPRPGRREGKSPLLPPLLLLGGSVLAVLFAGMVALMQTARRQTQRVEAANHVLAEEMTKQRD